MKPNWVVAGRVTGTLRDMVAGDVSFVMITVLLPRMFSFLPFLAWAIGMVWVRKKGISLQQFHQFPN